MATAAPVVGLAGLSSAASGSIVPSLPPQSGSPAASCSSTAGAPGSVTVLTTSSKPFQAFVDPANPCLIYRATNPQTVERSSDSGATWMAVFQDRAGLGCDVQPAIVGPCSTEFTATSLDVAQDRSILLSEWGNGDAVVGTSDEGHTWQLRDTGLEGLGVAYTARAPSDPLIRYALASTPGPGSVTGAGSVPAALFISSDGGNTWSPRPLPARDAGAAYIAACQTAAGHPQCTRPLETLAVDPTDPGHIWLVAPTQPDNPSSNGIPVANGESGIPFQWDVFESLDSGQSWTDDGRLPATHFQQTKGPQLAIIRSPHHKLRIVASGTYFVNFPSATAISDDDGATWRAGPVPNRQWGDVAVGVNPADHDQLVIARSYSGYGGGPLDVFVSSDGLDTATPMTDLSFGGTTVAVFGGSTQLQGTFSAGDGTLEGQPTQLQEDAFGNAYLTVMSCPYQGGTCGDPGTPDARPPAWLYVRITPPRPGFPPFSPPAGAPPSSSVCVPPNTAPFFCVPSPGGSPAPPGTLPTSPSVPAPPLSQIRTCPVPGVTGIQPNSSDSSMPSGSVAFEGHELLYTHTGETEATAREAVIHTLDPTSCSPLPDIHVAFHQADLNAWAAAQGWAGSSCQHVIHPTIGDLGYDPVHNLIWASIGDADPSGSCQEGSAARGLFTISVGVDSARGRIGTASAAILDNGCGFALAYDAAQGRVWSCDQSIASGVPSELDPRTGQVIPSCASSMYDAYFATWTLAGLDHVYVENEDDTTLNVFDARSCELVGQYEHRPFIEPLHEDEQMACDSVTFATPVLWVRDAEASTLSAYTIPETTCFRVPTIGSSPLVKPPLGTATIAPSSLGGLPPPQLPPQSLPAPGPHLNPAPGTEPVTNASVQAESQAQAQSQSQAQAQSVAQVQPGVMVQRQRRTQVAIQQQRTGGNTAYEASALHRSPTPGMAVAATVLTFGFALLGRRPRWSTARSDRGRR